ncbi:MAG TPA: ABC transporter permease [Lacunisphaera sp.]|jgi:putative ABC transport system permease protein|nr:ABC transporter permease [Lacunisphaera sp.]
MDHLRLALRLLGKSPGFTALVTLVLALGIGANTAIFSLVDNTCLRALPYPEADRLVHVTEHSGQYSDMSVSYPNFLDWRAGQDLFTGLAIYRTDGAKLKTPDASEQITVAQVSQDFFAVLGVHAAVGRDLRADDDRVGAAPVVWLTNAAWQRFFHGQPDLAGRTVILDGNAATVAGILPPAFRFYRAVDAIVPIEPIADAQFMRERANHNGTNVVGRLKPGATIEAARSQLGAIAQRLAQQYTQSNAGVGVKVQPLRERLQGESTTRLYLLMGAVGMVLLIACVNVANMLLARSFGRSREMAIRTALGATRGELLRQLLTESLLLAFAGGLLGLLAGRWGYDFVSRLAPWEMRELLRDGGFDYGVWFFVAGITMVAGVAFGLAPAWQLSHTNPNDALKNTRPVVRTLFGRFHLADVLVFVQVALAVMLLVGAGLLIRSLERLNAVPTGLQPDHVLTLRIANPPDASITRNADLFVRHHEALLDQVRAVPGVESAAFCSSLPYTWNTSSNSFFRADRPLPEPGKFPNSNLHVVTPDYFRAMGIPLLRGSLFDGHEPRAPLPDKPITLQLVEQLYTNFTVDVVISRKMAEQHWPGEDPIGKTFQLGNADMKLAKMRIIGVVGNTTQTGAEDGEKVEYYTLLSQWPATIMLHLVVRTANDPRALVATLRRTLHEAAPDEPIFDVELMTDRIAGFSSDRRFNMGLFAFFAATALLLASLGIYGVLACLVGQRTREFGVRMALGAQPGDVLRNVIGRGLLVALPGALAGLAAAWAGSRALQSQLFGVSGADLPTYSISAALLVLAALVACILPARRATQVNPTEALRAE